MGEEQLIYTQYPLQLHILMGQACITENFWGIGLSHVGERALLSEHVQYIGAHTKRRNTKRRITKRRKQNVE
jgi:hypothetical protein